MEKNSCQPSAVSFHPDSLRNWLNWFKLVAARSNQFYSKNAQYLLQKQHKLAYLLP